MISCEAKTWSANKGGKLTVGVRNLAKGFIKIGIPLPDVDGPTVLYNYNKAMVNWVRKLTTKGVCHLELCETKVREWDQEKIVQILHVAGKYNPSDNFTKEMKDGAHFCCLCDSFM